MLDNVNFNLYLIRHGESEINIDPDIMGQTSDVKLTEFGEYQAKMLSKNMLNYDFVYSSPYVRAVNTAKIALGDSSNIKLVPELREYNAGDWTYCSRNNTITKDIKLKMAFHTMQFKFPNGESQTIVERRASEWLENEILYNKEMLLLSKNKILEIAAFSHGMTIRCLLHYVMGFDRNFLSKIEIENTSITKLSFRDNGWRLHYLNNTSHLNFQ